MQYYLEELKAIVLIMILKMIHIYLKYKKILKITGNGELLPPSAAHSV